MNFPKLRFQSVLSGACAAALLGLLLLVPTACTQGEGDHCQVTSDCEDGLVCNAGKEKCERPGGGNVSDAMPSAPDSDVEAPDADISDGDVPDGDIPDASAPDAGPADAGTPDAT